MLVSSREQSSGGRWWVALFAVSFLLGAFLRFFRLDAQGLWLDEIFSVFPTYEYSTLRDLMNKEILVHAHPPTYQVFLWYYGKLAGYADPAMRLTSAVFSFTAVLLFTWGLKRVAGVAVALSGAILIAVCWPTLYYAQEVRNYAALFLVSVLVTLAFLNILVAQRDSAARRKWWLLLAATLVASYIHLYGFILSMACWGYLGFSHLVMRRPGWLKFAGGLALTILAFAPWLTITLVAAQERAFNGANVVSPVDFKPPKLSFFIDIGAFLYHHPIPALLVAVLPTAAGLYVGWFGLRQAVREQGLFHPLVALFCICALPTLAIIAFSLVHPMIKTHHLMVFVPAVVAWVAIAYQPCMARWPRGAAVALFLLAVTSLAWILPDHYRPRHREQTREAAAYVTDRMAAGDAVVAYCIEEWFGGCVLGPRALSARLGAYIHYLNYSTLPRIPLIPETYATPEDAAALAQRHRQQQRNVFLIMSREAPVRFQFAQQAYESEAYRCAQPTLFFRAMATHCIHESAGTR